ncbi:unnamed protein product [Amoebophrya sp. A120]|nr:unnamed protein product [Amoebophrya sp. A120]|eukprot:GSA120T00003168001.1
MRSGPPPGGEAARRATALPERCRCMKGWEKVPRRCLGAQTYSFPIRGWAAPGLGRRAAASAWIDRGGRGRFTLRRRATGWMGAWVAQGALADFTKQRPGPEVRNQSRRERSARAARKSGRLRGMCPSWRTGREKSATRRRP